MAKAKPKKSAATVGSGGSENGSGGSRRARLASFEAARKKEQRRRSLLLLGVCVVLAAALLAYPVFLFVQDYQARNATIADIGASASEAGCDPVAEHAATGNQEHVAEGTKVPCTEPHQWRAVTTIKLGEPDDPYPGDRIVEVTSRDYCSDSVGAWLNYPVDYQFGYTWFHEAEWQAGNRRSVCWAKTSD